MARVGEAHTPLTSAACGRRRMPCQKVVCMGVRAVFIDGTGRGGGKT